MQGPKGEKGFKGSDGDIGISVSNLFLFMTAMLFSMCKHSAWQRS